MRCAADWLHPLSSHRPCDTFWAPTPLHCFLPRKNISRKKDLYGKTKKCTHDHQTLILARTQPCGMPGARPRRRRRPRRLGGCWRCLPPPQMLCRVLVSLYRVLVFPCRVLIYPLQGTYFLLLQGTCPEAYWSNKLDFALLNRHTITN